MLVTSYNNSFDTVVKNFTIGLMLRTSCKGETNASLKAFGFRLTSIVEGVFCS